MNRLAVQLNHPGSEKRYLPGRGYGLYGNNLIREWNSDTTHYRKFLAQKGWSINAIGEKPVYEELLFWGEWEGNSYFDPLPQVTPNGIHRPFHSLHLRNHQNTDPYVFGDKFLYAICKQRGRLTKLEYGSMVLFGSSYKQGFVLDTVFIVGGYQTAHEVAISNAAGYSNTYKEATLEQLEGAYSHPDPASNLRLYEGLMYQMSQEFFSYVPCRPFNDNNKTGFRRVVFPYNQVPGSQFSSNPTGVKIICEGEKNVAELWKGITKEVLRQGFSLGVHFDEPEKNYLT